MNEARLILDPPAPGNWNMAVDDALLNCAAVTNTISLRIYAWEEPTLSLGYFQPYGNRSEHSASRDCPAVRRATGGGAILHDHELTYSLIAPIRDRTDRHIESWYNVFHRAWITILADWRIDARLCEQTDTAREDAFLCFQRRTKGDLLLGHAKIGGSAQRRHHNAVLQHGSLLLQQSAAAPELPGILELTHNQPINNDYIDPWTHELARQLSVSWSKGSISTKERELATTLEKDKYGDANWTLRR